MARRINDDYHIKIFILYLFDKLDQPLSLQTAAEIVLWDGTVNYFVFMTCFEVLCTDGMLEQDGERGDEALFRVSAQGRELLNTVEDALLEETKKKILHSASRLLAYRRDGSEVKAFIEPENEGYLLHCTIRDRKYPLLNLSIYLDHEEEAQHLKDTFDERADIVYRGVLALLSGEAKFLG